MPRSHPLREHPFSKLEAALQLIIDDLRGVPAKPAELTTAICQVLEGARQSAVRLLYRLNAPNVEIEADEVVQRWSIAMWPDGFLRCDPDRPAHRYVYQALRFQCLKVAGGAVSNLARPVEESWFDRMTWLDALDHTESALALTAAIASLPPDLRSVIEVWLQLPGNRRSSLRCKRARRRFHNRLYRARKLLRRLLATQPSVGTNRITEA